MKKAKTSIGICLLAIAGLDPIFPIAFDAQLQAFPDPSGSEFSADLGVRWDNGLRTGVALDYATIAGRSAIDDFPGSLNATLREEVNARLALLEKDFELGPFNLGLSGGARYYGEKVSESGVFAFLGTNQAFSNDYALDVFGPQIGLSLAYANPSSRLYFSASYTPLAYFMYRQGISISPLVPEAGSAASANSEAWFYDLEGRATLFNTLSLGAAFKHASLSFTNKILIPADGAYAFGDGQVESDSDETALTAALIISLRGGGQIELGGGYAWNSARDRLTGVSTVTGKRLFTLVLRY